MENKKNPLLLAASICLIVLAAISLGYTLYTNLSSNQMSPSNMDERSGIREGEGNFSPEDFTGQPEQSEQSEQSERPEQPEQSIGEGQDDSMLPEGFDDSQRTQGDNFQQGEIPENFSGTGVSIVNRISWLSIGIYAAALILSVLAAIFIRKGKKWGAILGVFLSVPLAGVGLLSLFNAANWLPITISLVKLLLGIGVIVLLFLPGARKVYRKKKDIFDEDDYALYYGEDETEKNADDETGSESE